MNISPGVRLLAVAVFWISIQGQAFTAELASSTPAGGATAELELKHFGQFLQPGHSAKHVAFHDLFLATLKATYHVTSQHSQVLRLCRYEETVADDQKTLKSSRKCQLSALINLGRYSEAETMALNDGQLIPSDANPDITDRILSWERIASLTMNQGQLFLAEKAHRKILALADEALKLGIPAPSDVTLNRDQLKTFNEVKLNRLFDSQVAALNHLADIAYSQQRFKEYEALVVDVLARIEAREQVANAWGINAIDHAMRLHHIGRRDLAKKLALLAKSGLKADAGFRDLAEPLQSYPLMAEAVATLGDERTQPAFVVSRTRLAKVYGLLGRYAEAERLLDATEELAKNYLLAPAPANPMLADVEETRADLAVLQSDFPKAIAMLRQARARVKEAALNERSLESGRRRPDINDPLLRLNAKFLAALVDSGKHQLTDGPGVREVAEILLDFSASRASLSVELASRSRHATDGETRSLLDREGRLVDELLDARGAILTQIQVKDQSGRKSADAVLQRMSHINRELGLIKQQLAGRSEKDQQQDIAAQVQKFQSWLQGSRVFWQWVAHPNVNLAVRWTSTGISLAELRSSSEVIRQRVARLQAGGNLREITAFAQLRRYPKDEAAALYEALFGQLAQPFTGTQHWIVAPSALVDAVPWAALSVKSSDKKQKAWLIEQAALSVTPSWRDCLTLALAPPVQVKHELLAIGNPLNRNALVSLKNLSKRGVLVAAATNTSSVRTVEDTAFAQELTALSHMFPAHLVTVRAGQRATKAELARLTLSDYRIIVFSTHGYLANQLAAAAGPSLELTAKSGAPADRFLSAAEIARFRLNAEIVVLSACDTSGSDGHMDSEGFSGLTSAFLFAGARNVVATLWPVETHATKFLTTRMLKHYVSGAEPGAAFALRRATLELIRSTDGRRAHPAFWSAFVVVGQ